MKPYSKLFCPAPGSFSGVVAFVLLTVCLIDEPGVLNGAAGSPSPTFGMTLDAPPTPTTNEATNVTTNSATLRATVNPNSLDTYVHFEWGITTSYGNSTPDQWLWGGGGTTTITSDVWSLSANTLYHYRVVASNLGGTMYGGDVTFSTIAGNCSTPAFLSMSSISVGTSYFVSVADLNADEKADLAISGGQGVSVKLGNGDGTFGLGGGYTTGSIPQSSVPGDFNADGKWDLAVANWYSNNVSILLGNGNGSFQTAVNYDVGTRPVSIAAGDFNGDGKLDLAVANESSNNVSILLGKGDGTFQAAVNFGAGTYPQSVVVGDFDEDGWLDLAVANQNSNDVSILLGKGDGTFQAAVNLGAGTYPQSVVVGDFNGDGKLDLAVANQNSNNVSILLGNGDGNFQTAVNYTAGTSPRFAVALDFNMDGHVDLVVVNSFSGNISLLVGIGDGTFQVPLNYGVGSWPEMVAVGNFNADTKPDLAVVKYTNISILLNARSPTCPMLQLSPSALKPGFLGLAYSETITSSGGSGPYSYIVNGGALPPGLILSSSGILSGTPTTLGKYGFTITAIDSDGYTFSRTYPMAVTTVFNDVPLTHPFYSFITALYSSGVTAGCGGGNYCPDASVTREQMAIFIERSLGVFTPPTPGQQTFEDVLTSWFSYPFVEDFSARGITGGCSVTPKLYCPGSTVTREQMAIFIERALGAFTPPTPAQQTFEDVPTSWFSYPFIEDFATRGITGGCSVTPKLYCPSSPVTRGQMAVFLVRAFGL